MPLDRDVIAKALRRKGFRESTGKHLFYHLYCGETKQAIMTMMSHGTEYKTIGDGLLSKMSRQLQLSRKEFASLVDCTMDGPEYMGVLKSKKVELTDCA